MIEDAAFLDGYCSTLQGSLDWFEVDEGSLDSLGCHNGGGGGNFPKVKRLVATWIGTQKRFFSGFFVPGVILETQELFPQAHFTHKPTYAYLPLFMSSCNMQVHWDSDLFCFGVGRICGVFPPLLRYA